MPDTIRPSEAPEADYPSPSLPTMFADGVMNIANSGHIVKFYLARSDPAFNEAGSARVQAFAQVVLPMDGFIQTVLFFQNSLKKIVNNGFVTQAEVDRVEAAMTAANEK